MMTPKKYAELDYFNAAACLCVILIHVLSVGITSLARDSWQMTAIYLPWKLASYAVRGFMFTGAVKMALGFSHEEKLTVTEYWQYILRRIRKIYVPYILWVIIYYLFFLLIGWVEPGIDVFLNYLLCGNISAQLYYIVAIMQFYLLMPLWRWTVRRIPWFIALPVSALISFVMLYSDSILAHFGCTFSLRGIVFPTYLLFWVIGLYVGENYDAVRTALKKYAASVWGLLFPILLCGFAMQLQFSENIQLFDEGVVKMFMDSMSVCAVLTLCIQIADRANDGLKKGLGFVYRASFFVYLSHCLILQIAALIMSRCRITDIGTQMILRALICYTVPFLLWYGWDWIKRGAVSLRNKRKVA